jgi:hypothetical protein
VFQSPVNDLYIGWLKDMKHFYILYSERYIIPDVIIIFDVGDFRIVDLEYNQKNIRSVENDKAKWISIFGEMLVREKIIVEILDDLTKCADISDYIASFLFDATIMTARNTIFTTAV